MQHPCSKLEYLGGHTDALVDGLLILNACTPADWHIESHRLVHAQDQMSWLTCMTASARTTDLQELAKLSIAARCQWSKPAGAPLLLVGSLGQNLTC